MSEQFTDAAKAFRDELLPALTVNFEEKGIGKLENKEKDFEAAKMIGDGKLEPKLSRTESFMARSLENAINGNDVQGMTDAMNAISENQDSAHRVLNQVRRGIERDNPKTMVQFQTGRDQDGQNFANMQIHRPGETVRITPHSADIEPHLRPEWIKPNKFQK